MDVLIQNFSYITWQMLVMWAIGGVLIYLGYFYCDRCDYCDCYVADKADKSIKRMQNSFFDKLDDYARKYQLPQE